MPIKSKLDLEVLRLRTLAPAGYFIGLHIRFTSPMMVLHSYDQTWIDYYTENGFVVSDPTTVWALSNSGVVRWNDERLSDPQGVLEAARDFGLVYGVTCSHGPPLSRTIGSFARADREHSEEEVEAIQASLIRLHQMTAPNDDLTDAQIDALRRIAGGDRHAEAARKLGISESALKARISGARQRLKARTTAEAIQRAKDYRLI